MKKISSFLFLLLLSSCGISYDGETRLVNEFHVVDSNGESVAGVSVAIIVGVDEQSETISNGITDQNGNLRLIFSAPSDANGRINFVIADNNPTFLSKTYRNILKSDYVAYKISLDNIVLYKPTEATNLFVTTQQTTPNTGIQNLSVISSGDAQHIDYHPFDMEFETNFNVLKNQTVTLGYTLIDFSVTPAIETNHTVAIPIGNDPVDYTLTY